MKRFGLGVMLLLMGCASAHPMTAPDGRRAFATICERNWQTIADCHKAAREACGGDYDVLRTTRYSLDVACKG